MFSRFFRWIDERWPLSTILRSALDEEMSGGASYAYVFGSAALILFLLQVATGIWQLFYYVPLLSQGYNSLNYLRTEIPFGWLIHGFHYWGANAMVVLVMLHLSQVFIWGAYKRPHELQWITGVFLFFLTMAMSLTGGALPWDKRSYWLVEVASSAASTVPVIGDLGRQIILAGGVIGQLTLSRFFILHAAILSGALFTLVAIHLVALRTVGNAGPWDERKRGETGPFWPDQVFKDGITAGLLILLLVALCVMAPPPFSGMADPLDAFYIPKPEWNFLFFYEAVKFFPGRLEVIATVGIPVGAVLILLLIPFVDRAPERRPSRRPLAITGWVIAVAAFIALTLAGAYGKPEGTPGVTAAASPPAAASKATLSAGEKVGSDLFLSQGCVGCHRAGGAGGKIGPDLSGEGLMGHSRQWLAEQLHNPKAHNPATVMPSFASLSESEVGHLVDYLLGLKQNKPASASAASAAAAIGGQEPAAAASPSLQDKPPGAAVTMIGSTDHGKVLFEKTCASCHGPQGAGGIANPGSTGGVIPPLNPINRDLFNPDSQSFAEKIDLPIQHGSRPVGTNPRFSMSPFGSANILTQQQIADLEAYVAGLNGVDRTRINHPGISPDAFLIVTTFGFLWVGVSLCGWWWFGGAARQRKKRSDER